MQVESSKSKARAAIVIEANKYAYSLEPTVDSRASSFVNHVIEANKYTHNLEPTIDVLKLFINQKFVGAIGIVATSEESIALLSHNMKIPYASNPEHLESVALNEARVKSRSCDFSKVTSMAAGQLISQSSLAAIFYDIHSLSDQFVCPSSVRVQSAAEEEPATAAYHCRKEINGSQ
ncbi:conserved hypothetical protein [Ricinus communis]|uniref:Uncharacterized protein n=1 Tax=Ricinus communis TaxID=3988 RepID=B9SSA7_RICCO|nr:conserved hypothetical protein [Ricinus communis]